MTYWSVPREWPGETAFILAGGPSLRGFTPDVLRGRGRIIAVNNSYLLCPWADVLYGCDRGWWNQHIERARQVFLGKYKVSIQYEAPDVHRLQSVGPTGLALDPRTLKHGCNSGYQAIGLAYHFGASRIVLLGYDMHITPEATHWHGGHPTTNRENLARTLTHNMLPNFRTLVEPLRGNGIEVINCTPGSALACWPIRPLKEILREPVAA